MGNVDTVHSGDTLLMSASTAMLAVHCTCSHHLISNLCVLEHLGYLSDRQSLCIYQILFTRLLYLWSPFYRWKREAKTQPRY